MRYSIISLLSFAALTFSAPTPQKRAVQAFPLADGFPNPSPEQLRGIQRQAFGTLSNNAPPAKISDEGVINLKLVAFNELFEVAFFSELFKNVTEKVPGFELGDEYEYISGALSAILAVSPHPSQLNYHLTNGPLQQEKLHQINANNGVKRAGQPPIEACKYVFPVSNFREAIDLAATFTDVVLGVLQDVNQIFAKNGDDGLVRGTSSSLGQEGEQEGFYHVLQNKRPSTLPFLTTNVRDFAFTAIQSFVVPGSCPNINTIPLKTFKPLRVLSRPIKPATQNLNFSFFKRDTEVTDYSQFSMVYINQQNKPIVKPLENIKVNGDVVEFTSPFPYDEFEMNGLTIAAVTKGAKEFANAKAVADAAVFGPGFVDLS